MTFRNIDELSKKIHTQKKRKFIDAKTHRWSVFVASDIFINKM